MTDEQFKILENRLISYENQLKKQNDLLARIAAFLDVLSRLLVPNKVVTERLKLHRNTLTNNKKLGRFQPIERRRNYIEVGETVFVEMNRPKSRLKQYFDEF